MYGHWIHCNPKVCEFQHGSTMIYVSYTDEKPMDAQLEVARRTIASAFDEAEGALSFAAQVSETQHPDFWSQAKRIELRQKPLVVFGIRYGLDDPFPVYEISWNPVFQPVSGVAMSDDWVEELIQIEAPPANAEFIHIRRTAAHQFEIASGYRAIA